MSSSSQGPLSNTLLQRGVRRSPAARNRFNGFNTVTETVQTVSGFRPATNTPLKQGVNEKRNRGPQKAYEISGLKGL